MMGGWLSLAATLSFLVQRVINDEVPLLGMMPGEDFSLTSYDWKGNSQNPNQEPLMNKIARGYLENFQPDSVITNPDVVHGLSAAGGPPLIVLACQVKKSQPTGQMVTFTVTYQERTKTVTMLSDAEKLFVVGLKACTHSNPVVVLEPESKNEPPALRAFCKIETGEIVMFWASVGEGLKGPFTTQFKTEVTEQTTLVKAESYPFVAIYFREVNKQTKVLSPTILLFNTTEASLESSTNAGTYRGSLLNLTGYELEKTDSADTIEFLRVFLPENKATAYESRPRLTLLMSVRSPSAARTTRTVLHAVWPNSTLDVQRPLSKVCVLHEMFDDGQQQILNLWEDGRVDESSGTGVQISVAYAMTEAQEVQTYVEKWGYTISVDKDTAQFVVSSYKHVPQDDKRSYLWSTGKSKKTIKSTSDGISVISNDLLPSAIQFQNPRSIRSECLSPYCKDRFIYVSDIRQVISSFNSASHLIVSTSENKIQVFAFEKMSEDPEIRDSIIPIFPQIKISGSTGHVATAVPTSLVAHLLEENNLAPKNFTFPATTTHGMDKLRLLAEQSATNKQEIEDLGAAHIQGIGASKLVGGLWNNVKTKVTGDLEIYSQAASPISYYRKTQNKDGELELLRGKNLGDFDNVLILNTGEFLSCQEASNSLNKSAICSGLAVLPAPVLSLLPGSTLTAHSFVLLRADTATGVCRVDWVERATGRTAVVEVVVQRTTRFFMAAELGNSNQHLAVLYELDDSSVVVEIWIRDGKSPSLKSTLSTNSSQIADIIFSHRYPDSDLSVVVLMKNYRVEVFGLNSTKIETKPLITTLELPNAGTPIRFCQIGNSNETIVLDKTALHYTYVSDTEGRISLSLKDFPRPGVQILGLECSDNRLWLRTSAELFLFESGTFPFRFESERWAPRGVWEGISAQDLIVPGEYDWWTVDTDRKVTHYTCDRLGKLFALKGNGSLEIEVANTHQNTKISIVYKVVRKPNEIRLPGIFSLPNSQLSSEDQLTLNLEKDFLLENHISNINLVSTNSDSKLQHKATEVLDFRPSGITRIGHISSLQVTLSAVGLVVFGENNSKQKVMSAYISTSAAIGEVVLEHDWDVRDLRVSVCGCISGWALRGYGRRGVVVFAGSADRSSKKISLSTFEVPQLRGIASLEEMSIRTTLASDCLKWSYLDPVARQLILASNCQNQESLTVLDSGVHILESILISRSEMLNLYQKHGSNTFEGFVHNLATHTTHKVSINLQGSDLGSISQIKLKVVTKSPECELNPPETTDIQILITGSKMLFFTLQVTRKADQSGKFSYTVSLSDQPSEKPREYLPISNSRILEADFSATHVILLTEPLKPNPITDGSNSTAADQTKLWVYSRTSAAKHTRMVLSPPMLLTSRLRRFSFVTDNRLLLWTRNSDRAKIQEVQEWMLVIKRANVENAKLVLEGPTGLTTTVSVSSLVPKNNPNSDSGKYTVWIWLGAISFVLLSVIAFLGFRMMQKTTKAQYHEARAYEEELSDAEHTLEIRDSSKQTRPSLN